MEKKTLHNITVSDLRLCGRSGGRYDKATFDVWFLLNVQNQKDSLGAYSPQKYIKEKVEEEKKEKAVEDKQSDERRGRGEQLKENRNTPEGKGGRRGLGGEM